MNGADEVPPTRGSNVNFIVVVTTCGTPVGLIGSVFDGLIGGTPVGSNSGVFDGTITDGSNGVKQIKVNIDVDKNLLAHGLNGNLLVVVTAKGAGEMVPTPNL